MQNYINIRISIPEEYFDIAYGILYSYPFTGIEEKYDEIIVCFPAEFWNDELKYSILKGLKNIEPTIDIIDIENIPDRNWNEEYEKKIQSVIVSERIGIAPQWKINELNRDIEIIINPKMSFGSGDHQTTRLMCRMMENTVKPDSFWIDAGCGTGVLAILAVKLGAKEVLAFDNNSWAIENALENFKINNVENNIHLFEGDIDSVILPEADGIAANLYSHLLNSSFPIFFNSLKNNIGDLIISGILKYDADEVIQNALCSGFEMIKTSTEDDWVAAHLKAFR